MFDVKQAYLKMISESTEEDLAEDIKDAGEKIDKEPDKKDVKDSLKEKIALLKKKYEIDTSAFEKAQMTAGLKVEKEHKNLYDFLKAWADLNDIEFPLSDDEVYGWILAAHVDELDDYYTRLAEMEKSAKSPVKKEKEDEA